MKEGQGRKCFTTALPAGIKMERRRGIVIRDDFVYEVHNAQAHAITSTNENANITAF